MKGRELLRGYAKELVCLMKRCKSIEMKRKAKRLEDEGCKMWWLLWMNGWSKKGGGVRTNLYYLSAEGEGG